MSDSARRSLAKLNASILLAPDFPKRIRYSHAQYLELCKARSQSIHDSGRAAIKLARDQLVPLQDSVRQLGKERYKPAVPILTRMWEDCSLEPVWVAAGHALFAIATPEAMSALLCTLEDHDHFGRHMAIKAAFARGSAAAFDYLDQRLGLVAGEHWAVGDVLSFLHGGGIGSCLEDRLSDPRWVELCAHHRKHRMLGHAAREVLRVVPAVCRERALREAKAAEIPPAPPRVQRDGTLLQRYESGELEQVWREIRAHENVAGAFREEVLEVAEAAMQRVAHNADLLAERLKQSGWRSFHTGLRTSPAHSDRAVIARIEKISGAPLPATLLAFWRVVGGINWAWDCDAAVAQPDLGFDLPPEEHDALCIYAPSVVSPELKEWVREKAMHGPDLVHPFQIILAPDYLFKANFSGGEPYSIEVPFTGADPLLANEEHGLPFLDYLRLAFRWAGFPGLERHAQRRDVQEFIARFSTGLVPF